MKFTDYTAQLPSDPSYYGSECTSEDAERINKRLAEMIQDEFPGISIQQWNGGTRSASTLGPDDSVCQQVDLWIAENWTAAL